MRTIAVLVAVLLCGCADDLLNMNPRGMGEAEKGVIITKLWRTCKDAIDEYDGTAKENHLARIKILEDALPYGRKAFEIAPYTSHQATLYYALCAFYVGSEYQIWKESFAPDGEMPRDEKTKRLAEEYGAAAKEYFLEAIKRFTHYQQYYFDSNPNFDILFFLSVSYETVGDTRSAYLVAARWLRRLERIGDPKQGPIDPVLDQQINYWRKVVESLKKKLVDKLEPVPEEPER